ncbi:MAG: hypothetical protein ACLPVY_09700 [Acidimicrobiia bacterium]
MPTSDELQRLVDDRRFDELLREVTLADVVRAWMRYQHRYQAEGDLPGLEDPDWWAVDVWMDEGWWADEERVRAGILELVAAAETESDFGVLGAAIMEMFVADDDDRLCWLEEQARDSSPFRRSLANVHLWGEVRDEVAARVEAAAGVRLPRPRNWTGP